MSSTVSAQVSGRFVGCVQRVIRLFGADGTGRVMQKLQLRNIVVTELTRRVTSVVDVAPSPDESDHA